VGLVVEYSEAVEWCLETDAEGVWEDTWFDVLDSAVEEWWVLAEGEGEGTEECATEKCTDDGVAEEAWLLVGWLVAGEDTACEAKEEEDALIEVEELADDAWLGEADAEEAALELEPEDPQLP
jgi:hypothetical protein